MAADTLPEFVDVGPYRCEVLPMVRVVDRTGMPVPYRVCLTGSPRIELDRSHPDHPALLAEAVADAVRAIRGDPPSPPGPRLVPVVGPVR